MKLFSLVFMLSLQLMCATLTNGDKVQFPDTNKIIKNPGIENGITGWTQNSGTLSRDTTTAADGVASLKFAASGANNNFSSDVFNAPAGLANRSAVAVMKYKFADASAGNLSFQVYDSTNAAILANQQLSSTVGTNWAESQLNFIAPSAATNMQLRIMTAGAIAGNANFDSFGVYDASRVNISQVSQAEFVGSVKYVGKTNCNWTRTSNASWADYSADADCNTPTATEKASIPATLIPAIKFTSLPPGNYHFVATGSFASTSAAACVFRFSDGTNNSSTNSIYPGATTPTISGYIKYSSAQSNITISIQATGQNGNNPCGIDAQLAVYNDFEIQVYRFPTTSETAYRADTINKWGKVVYAGTTNCAWNSTSASFTNYSQDADCSTPVYSGAAIEPTTTKTPALKVAALPSGTYFVYAQGLFYANGTPECQYRISDGTNYSGVINLSSSRLGHLAGIFNFSSMADREFNVQVMKVGGSTSCNVQNELASSNFEMGIIPISQSFPMPQIVNSVSSDNVGQVKHNTATLNCDSGSAITSQDGSWISSIGNVSGGACAVTIATGAFSSTPRCYANALGTTKDVRCQLNPTSATAATLYITKPSDGSDLSAADCDIFCSGAK